MIGVIGLGFVGGALFDFFKQRGVRTFGYDLKYQDDWDEVVKQPIVFLCLPTPTLPTRNQDLSPYLDVLGKLRDANFGGIGVIKSTILPGTTDYLAHQYELRLCHNPEFLRERTAKQDFIEQPAILLGGDEGDTKPVADFYAEHFSCPVVCTSAIQTELAKYLHNTFLATKVAWFNQFFDVCQKYDASYDEVVGMANLMGKIGENHTKVPGFENKRGYSGSCFPKDTRAFSQFCQEIGVPFSIMDAAMEYNQLVRPHNGHDKEISHDA